MKKKLEPIVHKRMLRAKSRASFQLCRPYSVYFKHWSYADIFFKHWATNCSAFHWKIVNCKVCLSLKPDVKNLLRKLNEDA